MRDHQIPSIIEHVEHIALEVRAGLLARQYIARPRVVPTEEEGIADDAAEFAGYEYPHPLDGLNSAGWGTEFGKRCLAEANHWLVQRDHVHVEVLVVAADRSCYVKALVADPLSDLFLHAYILQPIPEYCNTQYQENAQVLAERYKRDYDSRVPALSNYLRSELDHRDWTIPEFVEHAERAKRPGGAGLSLSNAYLIIRDGKDNVRQDTFDLIARTLGQTPAELMVAIGKGHLTDEPRRARISARLRGVPDDALDSVDFFISAITRAKNDSGLSAKTPGRRRSDTSTVPQKGANNPLKDSKHGVRSLAFAAL